MVVKILVGGNYWCLHHTYVCCITHAHFAAVGIMFIVLPHFIGMDAGKRRLLRTGFRARTQTATGR